MKKKLKKSTGKLVLLGKSPTIESNVSLGVISSRLKNPTPLVIGDRGLIRSGSILYAGTQIGNDLQTGHYSIIREENKIGRHFCLWNHSVVDYGCTIGKNVKIHANCYVAQHTVIEDDVFLAPGVIIANDFHPGSPFSKECMRGPLIKRGAQIGCNATLLPFVTIGAYSLIGAGSVVTQDIPPYSVAVGNPAKVIKKINEVSCPVSSHQPYDFVISWPN